jgi:hypothetical protein
MCEKINEVIEVCWFCQVEFDVSKEDDSGYRFHKRTEKNIPVCQDCFNLYGGVLVL